MSTSARRVRCSLIFLAAGLLAGGSAMGHGTEKYTLDFHLAPPNTMPWGLLSKVGILREDGKVVPRFPPSLLALEGRSIVLYGYATAKPGGGLQKRFLLSPRPIFCTECDPLAPDEVVEVVAERAMPLTATALAVRGRLVLLRGGADGLLFRLENAGGVVTQGLHH